MVKVYVVCEQKATRADACKVEDPAGDLEDGPQVEISEELDLDQQRATWGGRLEFFLAMLGFAVGLGNVWRFPYLCYSNGGGAFLVPYFLMLFFVGMPIFFIEVSTGQFTSSGAISVWSVNPLCKGLGWSMVITNILIGIYYIVVITWSMFYFFASMQSPVPWTSCDNWWNTPACALNASGNITVGNETYQAQSPSEQYYFLRVLQISDGIDEAGNVVWYLALILLLCWAIVLLVLFKGIKYLGKIVYLTSTLPYILLTIMLIRGVTLPGSEAGIHYYLAPDWSKLTDASVWTAAATQIFYSLGACQGGLIVLASYNDFHHNHLRDAIMIPIINCMTSFYAGFVIFSVLGFMSYTLGVPVSQVATQGPGLVFVVYPEGLAQMPFPPIWSVLFFFMLVMLGFSSQFPTIECFFSALQDEFPWLAADSKRNMIFRIGSAICFFLIGLSMVTQGGYYVFNIFNDYTGSFPLLLIGFFETIVITWWYGYPNFAKDIAMMIGKKPNIFYKWAWRVVTPVLILSVIVVTAIQWVPPGLTGYTYPLWADYFGYLIEVICVMFFPIIFVYKIIRAFPGSGNICRLIQEEGSPSAEWGPRLPENRTDPRYGGPPENELPVIKFCMIDVSTDVLAASDCKIQQSEKTDECHM